MSLVSKRHQRHSTSVFGDIQMCDGIVDKLFKDLPVVTSVYVLVVTDASGTVDNEEEVGFANYKWNYS